MKVRIDKSKCEGKARCFNLYIDLFEEGPDGKGVVKIEGDFDDEDLLVDAQSAANACPHGAIIIEY